MQVAQVTLDPGALINGIVNGILNGLGGTLSDFAGGLWPSFINAISAPLSDFWTSLWGSGANLLATPFLLTLDYPPAQLLGQQLALVTYAITSLAIVLLGLRNLWKSMSASGGALGEAINGVLIGIMLAGASMIIVSEAYVLTGMMSDEIGQFNYMPTFDPHSLVSIGPAFVVTVFTFTVMLVYGWKLILRAAYRTTLLMFLTPFAPIAGALYGIPQTRWIATLYWVTFGGWLAGGFLAIGAISLGVQIASYESGGSFLVLMFGVALVQLAYDLLGLLPRAAFGVLNSGVLSVSMGGAAAAAATGAAAVGAAGVGAASVGAAAVGAAGSGLGAAAAIGSLPAGAGGLGYD